MLDCTYSALRHTTMYTISFSLFEIAVSFLSEHYENPEAGNKIYFSFLLIKLQIRKA